MRPRSPNESAHESYVPVDLARAAQASSPRLLTPAYLTEADHPWLAALLEERQRFVGQTRRAWKQRLGEPLPFSPPASKLKAALRVLDRLKADALTTRVAPRQIRAVVFHQAAIQPDRPRALAAAAALLNLSLEAVLEGLFADLPDERTLAALPDAPAPAQLALGCNAELIAGLLRTALRVRVAARGQVRAVVRHAKLAGLLCHVTPAPSSPADKTGLTLDVSGPYALFRHTRLYGRALASLVPRLGWCHEYRLEADCVLASGSELAKLVIRSGDPIAPARELRRYDSRVEEQFAKSFSRLARDWDLVREPSAFPVGDGLIFPDFELRHRITGARWLLEIVGYWTPEYVTRKLQQLRAARIERLIVCIDEERRCADGELAQIGHVVRYRRRVDARAVLAIVDPLSANNERRERVRSARKSRQK